MERISYTQLKNLVDYLNKLTGNSLDSYKNGKAIIGNYHISRSYGGVSLHHTMNEAGGIRDVFGCGHVTKRDLYNRIHALINGLNIKAAI
jgi:hypothetical protein